MIALAVGFAVLGAAFSAVGAQLQHEGVRAATRDATLRLSGLARLVHNPKWLLGFVLLVGCAVLQILALALAPVSVVAPIVVLALPIIAVLNARAGGGRLDRVAWFAVFASTGGVAIFVVLAAGVAAPADFPPGAVLAAGQFVAIVMVLFVVLAVVRGGVLRCIALAAAAGTAYGLVAVLVRDVTYSFQTEGLAGVPPLSATGLVVVFAVGSWLVQLAYSTGPPDLVVGFQTVLNPIVATGIGISLLDETTGSTGWVGAGLAFGAVLAVFGVVLLARHRPEAIGRGASTPGSGRPPGERPSGRAGAWLGRRRRSAHEPL